jgi:hypothetical protein
MADQRGTLKAEPELCSEVVKLAKDYRFGVREFTELLLEWLLEDIDRIDQAVELNRKAGSRKARARRVVVPIEQGRGTKP